MPGSRIYFVKLEQVTLLPCLLCHSFPAATRLYLIPPPFANVLCPSRFSCFSRNTTVLILRLSSLPPLSLSCGKGGKILDFSTLSTVPGLSCAFNLAKLHLPCQVTNTDQILTNIEIFSASGRHRDAVERAPLVRRPDWSGSDHFSTGANCTLVRKVITVLNSSSVTRFSSSAW